MRKKRYTRSEAAKILGVSDKTLINWEVAGKIPKPARDPMSNYRFYMRKDIERLKKITGRPL